MRLALPRSGDDNGERHYEDGVGADGNTDSGIRQPHLTGRRGTVSLNRDDQYTLGIPLKGQCLVMIRLGGWDGMAPCGTEAYLVPHAMREAFPLLRRDCMDFQVIFTCSPWQRADSRGGKQRRKTVLDALAS